MVGGKTSIACVLCQIVFRLMSIFAAWHLSGWCKLQLMLLEISVE